MSDEPSAIQVRVSGSLREQVENWRRSQEKIPPLSQALRLLLERALADDQRGKPVKDIAAA